VREELVAIVVATALLDFLSLDLASQKPRGEFEGQDRKPEYR
jgi:hypothetical protein